MLYCQLKNQHYIVILTNSFDNFKLSSTYISLSNFAKPLRVFINVLLINMTVNVTNTCYINSIFFQYIIDRCDCQTIFVLSGCDMLCHVCVWRLPVNAREAANAAITH